MKCRNDFVSNSSSCSYIVVSKVDPINAGRFFRKLTKCENRLEVDMYLQSTSSVIAHAIHLDPCKDYPGYQELPNHVRWAIMSDVEFSKWFYNNGTVKGTLDLKTVIPHIYQYYHANSRSTKSTDKKKHIEGVCTKITMQSINFTKWLIKQLGDEFKRNNNVEEVQKQLNDYEKQLNDGNYIYVLEFTYSGDGEYDGNIYADTDKLPERSIGNALRNDKRNIEVL